MIEDEVFTTSADLAIALKNRNAELVELQIIGHPSYYQVERAVQAVSDAGGHFNMIGTVFYKEVESCPRCHLITHVTPKLVLINSAKSGPGAHQSVWRASCTCEGVSVDDLKPEFAIGGQFSQGLYCESCSVAFIPEYMAKPAAPRYQSSPSGWRRIFEDGTLGPLLQRIADDPESLIR